MEETVYTLRVVMLNRWYPKININVSHNDWQIIRAKITKKEVTDEEFVSEYGQITLVGNMVAMEMGAEYLVKVTKEFNEKFQKIQYKVLYSQEIRDFTTKEQVVDFFRAIPLTDRQIKALYSISENPLELLDNGAIEEMCNAVGIGRATAEKMIERYEACKDYGPVYGELNKMGLTKALIDKLIRHYKSADTVLELIKTNPYEFADEIDGIGFKKADEIALKNGIDKHSKKRVRAFIIFTLHDIANAQGSTHVSYIDVMDRIDEFLGRDTPQDVIDGAIDELIDKKILWCRDKEYDDGEVETTLALMKYYKIEKKIADDIKRLMDAPSNITLTPEEIDVKIKVQEMKQGWQYTETQKYGVKVIADNNVVIIRGYGGTGKSSTVAGLLSCLGEDYYFHQCALSGKASVNLTDITGQDGKTIHRLLKYKPGEGFTVNEKNRLRTNMVILDEGSMVDIELASHLFEAIPTGAKLVILGDTNQLEAIGAGNLLLDMIDSEFIPVVTFNEIHRQGAKSGIIPFSIEIANGRCKYKQTWTGEETLGELQDLKMIGFKCPKEEEKPSIDLIMKEYKAIYEECHDISQITVVLPTNTRGTCTKAVNKLIQNYVLPRRKRGASVEIGIGETKCDVHKGDRIIILKNNYELDIYNGNVGEVIELDSENRSIIVDIYGRGSVEIKGKALQDVDLGYAISVHKAQGSTIPYLIYCVDYTHYVMLCKEQIYTGITRAKKKCVFIFETKALCHGIKTSKVRHKQTFLYHFLVNELE